ncbi:MAG: fibronectin type III domain-containing protein, partial [Acidobacteriota bacterium]
ACTSCTGVRDVDFAKHTSNTPATVSNFTQVRCGAGSGPCAKEVHCESYVPSEAIWDFANRDLPGPGLGPAWTTLDRLWYLSRSTATSSFSCTHTGTFTSNGCNAGSWWKTMRAVDDDDGNLANGTPHGGALFAAFNRHGIACTTDTGASTTFRGCTSPSIPTLTLTAGSNSAAVSWTSSGAGVVYDVFRNETGCNAGFTKIANDVSTTSYADNVVANNFTYYYQVTAQPTGNEACAAVPSTCLSVTPVSAPCTPPSAPTGVSVTATGQTTSTVSWTAVAGATGYNILRSTTSGGPYTQVGTSVTTSFADSGLTCNTAYFYVVQATNAPSCASASSAQATATTAVCTGCTTATLFTNGFETGTGLAGFSTGTFVAGGSTTSWRGIQTCTAQTGTKIFRYGGTTCTSDYTSNNFNYAQPNGAGGISVPAGSTVTRLSFGHRRGFESGFDGGTLAVSVDGTNYTFVPAAAVLTNGYNGTIAASCAPAGSAGASVWTGNSASFTTSTVDLDAACNAATGTSTGCAGRSVRIAFISITDCSVTGDGWFLDNVAVTACTP